MKLIKGFIAGITCLIIAIALIFCLVPLVKVENSVELPLSYRVVNTYGYKSESSSWWMMGDFHIALKNTDNSSGVFRVKLHYGGKDYRDGSVYLSPNETGSVYFQNVLAGSSYEVIPGTKTITNTTRITLLDYCLH